MCKANYWVMVALLLSGCGAPAYLVDETVYAGMPPLMPVETGARADGRPPEAPAASPEAPVGPQNTVPKNVVHVTASASVVQLLPQHTQTLRGTVTYTDGTRDSNVTYSSSDQTIVTVNPTTGEVTGVRPGAATIQVRAGADLQRFLNIPVMVREGIVEDVVATVVAPRSNLAVGETLQLEARVMDSASQAHLNGRWTSSNHQVAYVNDFGLVTARRPGQVTISFASEQDATVAGRVTLTVEDPTEAP